MPATINTFTEFSDYFEDLATSHVDVNSFYMGTVRQIIEVQRTEIEYPAMWLELPDGSPIDNNAGMLGLNRRCAFLILISCNPADFAEQKTAYALAEEICLQIIAKMIDDRINKMMLDINSFSIEAVSTLHTNTEYGWRVEFSLPLTGKICYDALKWA